MTRYGSVYLVTNTATGEQYVGQTRQKAKHLNMSHTGIRYAIRNKIKTQDKYTLVEVVN